MTFLKSEVEMTAMVLKDETYSVDHNSMVSAYLAVNFLSVIISLIAAIVIYCVNGDYCTRMTIHYHLIVAFIIYHSALIIKKLLNDQFIDGMKSSHFCLDRWPGYECFIMDCWYTFAKIAVNNWTFQEAIHLFRILQNV